MKNLKYISILLLIVGLWSCSKDEDAVVEGLKADFSYTASEETGTIKFINTSEGASRYQWDFGDGTTSTEINPTKVYPTGTYDVVLTAYNVAGAKSTFTDKVYVNIPLPLNFPVNFDSENVKYNVTTFNGTSFAIVDNPDGDSKVGALTNSGAQWEGFYFDVENAIDLSTLKAIKMNVWSDKAVPVLLKLEEGTSGPIEMTANHNGSGWQTLYFTFDSASAYSRITIFVDGPGNTAGNFYFDDFAQINADDVPCQETVLAMPIDFECASKDYATKIVGNVSFEVVDNPNGEGKVGKIVNKGENWENAFFNLDTPIDFSMKKGVKMAVYSDQALPLLLKFEDGTANPAENVQNHGGTGWEEMTFTLDSDASYNDMVIFVDGPGTAAGTFYVDNIMQVEVETPDPFDGGLITNGDFENGAASWIQGVDDTNPAPVADNNGNKYYSVNVENAGNSYDVNLSQKLAITPDATYKLTFDAWSDRDRNIIAGIGLSQAPWNNTTEAVAINTERKTYTVSLTANGFGDATSRVLFDLGAEVGMVNIDNVSLFLESTGGGTGGSSTALLDFEDGGAFTGAFDGGANGQNVDNPDKSGINTSAKVYQFNKVVGAAWYSGMFNVFGADLDASKGNVFKVKMWSPKAGINVRFQLEKEGNQGPIPTYNREQTINEANKWVELTFDFSGTAIDLAAGYDKIVIFPDYDESNQEAVATEAIYYVDDVTQQ